MEWLAIIALAVWVLIEHNRGSSLKREVDTLRARLGAAPGPRPTEPAPTHAGPQSGITPAMQAAARVAAETAKSANPLPAAAAAPAPAGPAPSPRLPAAQRVTRAGVEAWLAERGLAWIGGAALVIGGAFLVGYAAQQGFFGPPMRVAAAALLGLLLIGAAELVRRGRLAGFGANRLVGAILAGAGASILYGDAWASYGLYGFVDGFGCAAILIAVSASLMSLAFLHGEALSVLALGGAFAAPLISGLRHPWPLEALTLYMTILIAVGATVAWLRRWPLAAWANLAGVAIWALLAFVERDSLKCLLLGLEPLVVTAGLAYVQRGQLKANVGAGAVVIASVAAMLALTLAYGRGHPLTEGLIAAAALPVFTAALQLRSGAPAWSLIPLGAAFTLAAVVARLAGPQTPDLMLVWCAQLLALDIASLWIIWRTTPSALTSGAGALSTLALGIVAGVGANAGPLAPIGPAVATLALALGALRIATDRRRTADHGALELWGGAAAAALLTTLAVGLTWRLAVFAFAATALALALLGRRLRWRSVMIAAAAGAALALATLLSPDMLRSALSGGPGAAFELAAGLAVAVAAFAAARIVRADPVASEALRTLSPLAALVGGFVFLRWAAGAKTGLPLDGLTEASIRTFLIADAGLLSLARLGGETNAFARWRGHVLMGAAALHGLLLHVLIYNPAFGFFGDSAGGVIFLNTLAVAYLAPALVFGLAAWRVYRRQPVAGRIYALISLFSAILWAFLEVRRAVQGPHLAGGLEAIGAAEALGDSLVLLGIAALADRIAAMADRTDPHPFHGDLAKALTAFRWTAIGFALFFTAAWSNPWWGVTAKPLGGLAAAVAVLAGYWAVVLMIARLAFDARRGGRRGQSQWISAAAMLMSAIAASLVVRSAFQGADLTLAHDPGQLETWTYSAVWAAMGLGYIGAARFGGRLFQRGGVALLLLTTAKVFVIDTASLSGVVRAGSFLALGFLLLLGALTARRIAQGLAHREAQTPGAEQG